MAKKNNKSDEKVTKNDSTAFTKADWYGTGQRKKKKKQRKEKQY
jgi:hypothetical protein